MRIFILLTIFLLATGIGGRAQANTNSTAPRIVAMETSDFRKLRLEGFEALYNMDYQGAKAKFEQMARILPEHPAGHFYLATNLWLELLNSSRRLQSNIYNDDSFYAETKEKVDEKSDKEFRRLVGLALERAESAVKRNSRDQEALYYQGAAHGLIASYEGTVTRAFFSALRNGSKSVDLHKKVVEIDPNYVDAYLTIGTYNYIVGSLPLPVKLLAAIGGFRGSRSKGLEQLQKVADQGQYANDDARVVMIALFAREKRHQDALTLLETLSAKYPRNYVFKIERAAALVKLNRAAESHKIFDQLLQDKTAAKVADLVHFQYAETLAGQGQFDAALKHYRACMMAEGAGAELSTRSHLRSGHMLDLLGRRNEAIVEYSIVLRRANVFDSHDQAKKYLEKPYTKKSDED